jgi:hypothetical protein
MTSLAYDQKAKTRTSVQFSILSRKSVVLTFPGYSLLKS